MNIDDIRKRTNAYAEKVGTNATRFRAPHEPMEHDRDYIDSIQAADEDGLVLGLDKNGDRLVVLGHSDSAFVFKPDGTVHLMVTTTVLDGETEPRLTRMTDALLMAFKAVHDLAAEGDDEAILVIKALLAKGAVFMRDNGLKALTRAPAVFELRK